MQLGREQPLDVGSRGQVGQGALAGAEARRVRLDAGVEEVGVGLAAVDVLAVALVLVVDAARARGVLGGRAAGVEGPVVDLAAEEEVVADVAGLGGGQGARGLDGVFLGRLAACGRVGGHC